MTAYPDSWDELALVGIKRERDTNEVQFAGIIEDITGFDIGEKDIEGRALLNGGRAVRRIPMTDGELTLKLIPVGVALDGTGVLQHFHPQAVDDTDDPYAVFNTQLRQKHRIVIVWSTVLPATAEAVGVAGEPTQRVTISNAWLTTAPISFDDKSHTIEATFKWAPFTKSGTANVKFESGTAVPVVTATPTDASA